MTDKLELKSSDKVVDECIYGEQNPTWSEEDEVIISKILGICEDFKISFKISPASSKIVQKDIDKINNWLKSLKPRNRWKPSDEQMKCLSDVVHKAKYNNDISVGGYSAYMPLASLHLDLKKLKG